ncbi:MAG: hypothetical protein DUD34_07245 [Lactobacillus sp.]|nr:MAG: hypothetical protein DUD34_07245 [Lactobacillus sp.]
MVLIWPGAAGCHTFQKSNRHPGFRASGYDTYIAEGLLAATRYEQVTVINYKNRAKTNLCLSQLCFFSQES